MLDTEIQVKIYDVNGKTITVNKVKSSETSFDLSSHPSGLYILEVDLPGQGKQKAKVVLQHQ